jgi:integrator complex subunit 9
MKYIRSWQHCCLHVLYSKHTKHKVNQFVSEPDFPYLEALAPFQPLAMKAVHCPIDTSLNFTQANKLIRDLRPGTLVLPESYTLPPVTAPHRIDLVVETDRPIISFKRDEALTLPLKRKQGRVELSPELAEFLLPSEVRTGVSLTTLTGGLQVKDNKHILKVLVVLYEVVVFLGNNM